MKNPLKIAKLVQHFHILDGLKAHLRKHSTYYQLSAVENMNELLIHVSNYQTDVVILEQILKNTYTPDEIKTLKMAGNTKVLLCCEHATAMELQNYQFMGFDGVVKLTRMGNEFKHALHHFAQNKTYFSHYLTEIGTDMAPSLDARSKSNLLSPREIQITRLLCDGYTNKEVSTKLKLAETTVRKHRQNLFSKTDCHNIQQLLQYAMRNQILNQP